MRNYVMTLGLQWQVDYNSPTFGSGSFPQYVFGGDKEQLDSNVQALNHSTEQAFDADYSFSYSYPNQPQKFYWLLIKDTIINMINKINPAIWWNEGSLPADVQDVRNQVGVSPRQTWHPDRSVKPAKRQDFSGAPGLLQGVGGVASACGPVNWRKEIP